MSIAKLGSHGVHHPGHRLHVSERSNSTHLGVSHKNDELGSLKASLKFSSNGNPHVPNWNISTACLQKKSRPHFTGVLVMRASSMCDILNPLLCSQARTTIGTFLGSLAFMCLDKRTSGDTGAGIWGDSLGAIFPYQSEVQLGGILSVSRVPPVSLLVGLPDVPYYQNDSSASWGLGGNLIVHSTKPGCSSSIAIQKSQCSESRMFMQKVFVSASSGFRLTTCQCPVKAFVFLGSP